MLASFASFLWTFLKNLFTSVTSAVGSFIQGAVNAIGGFFKNLLSGLGQMFQSLLNGIGSFFQWLLNGIASFFQALFQPIFYLIQCVFLFFQELFTVLALLFELLMAIIHLLLSFAWGLIQTIAGLTYDNSSPTIPSSVSSPFQHIEAVFGLLQLDNVAYICKFAIWLMTAVTVVRMAGNFGLGAGGED